MANKTERKNAKTAKKKVEHEKGDKADPIIPCGRGLYAYVIKDGKTTNMATHTQEFRDAVKALDAKALIERFAADYPKTAWPMVLKTLEAPDE